VQLAAPGNRRACYSLPFLAQAPHPGEWVSGLGWRSDRAATPAGRLRRGDRERDNRSRENGCARHPLHAERAWLISGVLAVGPARAGRASQGGGRALAPARGAALIPLIQADSAT
jgi:hypothetical protein